MNLSDYEHDGFLVGIGYKAGVGKDTAGDYLRDNHVFVKEAFANPLKEASKVIFGFSDRQAYGDLKTEEDPYWGITPAYAFQRIGTEVGRNIREDIWIARLFQKVQMNPNQNFVITDVRFPNEAEAIKEAGGVLVNIIRPGRPDSGRDDEHDSETALDGYTGWDYKIVNDGTKQAMYDRLDAILDLEYRMGR